MLFVCVPLSNLGQAADWQQGLLQICRDYRGLAKTKHISIPNQTAGICLTVLYPVLG